MPGLSAKTTARARARLSYGAVTRQFRRLTRKVAGEFSRLTSAQCLCLPWPLVSPPRRLEEIQTRLDSQQLDSTLGAPRPRRSRAPTRISLPTSIYTRVQHSTTSAFHLVLFLDDVVCVRARARTTFIHPGISVAHGREDTPKV